MKAKIMQANLFDTQSCSTSWITIKLCQDGTCYSNLKIESSHQRCTKKRVVSEFWNDLL